MGKSVLKVRERESGLSAALARGEAEGPPEEQSPTSLQAIWLHFACLGRHCCCCPHRRARVALLSWLASLSPRGAHPFSSSRAFGSPHGSDGFNRWFLIFQIHFQWPRASRTICRGKGGPKEARERMKS